MNEEKPIPPEEWKAIVRNVPISSVDLLVHYQGGLILGFRQNEPVKGEWFVPGGTILKNERLTEAVQRVAREELGCTVEIVDSLGTYEHFYDVSEFPEIDSKHYLANVFVVEPHDEPVVADDQHSEFRVFESSATGLHPYVQRYFDALDDLPDTS